MKSMQYTEGCSVHCGDIMSTAEVVQYTEENTMTTLRAYHYGCGEYHEYTGGCSVHWGFYKSSFVFPMIYPRCTHDIPQCTEHPFPKCTHDIPHCTHDIPQYTEIPCCTAYSLVYCTDIMQREDSKSCYYITKTGT